MFSFMIYLVIALIPHRVYLYIYITCYSHRYIRVISIYRECGVFIRVIIGMPKCQAEITSGWRTYIGTMPTY